MKYSQRRFSIKELDNVIRQLLPDGASIQIDHVAYEASGLTLEAASTQPQGSCPVCGYTAMRVHSRYRRTLQDLPWMAVQVRLHVKVRRFFCDHPGCPRQIFTERLPQVAEPGARCTNRLYEAMVSTGWALGGEAGARQCRRFGIAVSAATMLSLLRRWGTISFLTPRVLGVDDWGFQRDHPTGTLLVDLERHHPVEVLLGSDEQMFADWLRAHPGVEIICRDRGASYQAGATQGAPQAQQVLDRWHLAKNLGEVLQRALGQRMSLLRQAAVDANATALSAEGNLSLPSIPSLPDPPLASPRPRKPPRRTPVTLSPRRAWAAKHL